MTCEGVFTVGLQCPVEALAGVAHDSVAAVCISSEIPQHSHNRPTVINGAAALSAQARRMLTASQRCQLRGAGVRSAGRLVQAPRYVIADGLAGQGQLLGWGEVAVESGHEGLWGGLEVDGEGGDFGGGPAAVGQAALEG